jgi:hypothetical protein
MDWWRRSRQGRTTPFSSPTSTQARIDRALLLTLLAIRGVHVIQGFTCVVTARGAYRRSKVATALAIGALVELLWLADHGLAEGRHQLIAARGDTLFGVAGLVALGSATSPADRTSSLNWMLPLTVGGCLGNAFAMSTAEGTASVAALTVAYSATTRDSLLGGSGREATAIANTFSYPAFYVVARVVIALLRKLATEVDEARQTAVLESSRTAAEAARNQEHRLLHDSALQTLEAIATGIAGVDDVRDEARREADYLRAALSGRGAVVDGLAAEFGSLGTEMWRRGLRLEVVAAELVGEPAPECAAALRDATREAVLNVAKHAGVDRAVLHVASLSTGGVAVTVRDHGRGFDLERGQRRFGIDKSIVARLSEVGGQATFWSEPGAGTRVELWVPS